MASSYEININAFQQYTMNTAKLYVKLYPWYYMPASVHTILIHGVTVIESALLPIGKICKTNNLKF